MGKMRIEGSTLWPNVIASWQNNRPELLANREFVGGKAVGLFILPKEWVPRFIVLTSTFHELVENCGSVAKAIGFLPPSERVLFDTFAPPLRSGPMPGKKVLVRSNAPEERLADRGSFRSYVVPCTTDKIADAIGAIFGSVQGQMCAIIQDAIEPGMQGHMSNERRTSMNRHRWLIEGLHDGNEVQQRYVRAHLTENAANRALMARQERELLEQLRTVAWHLLTIESGEHHCEWIWDGRRVWIVQCDDAARPVGPETTAFANAELRNKEESPKPFLPKGGLQHFRDVPPDSWEKLQRPREFLRLGLPTADVYFISGSDWMDSNHKRRELIMADLTEMCKQPVVIRSDVAKGILVSDMLLPTSKASMDANELAEGINSIAAYFTELKLKPEQWALLPAHLVPGKASAMVHAFPHAELVRVDAIWGFPDGLLHFAHDSWFFYPNEDRLVSRVRYKGCCLLPGGKPWRTLSVGPPLDWESVLREDEVRVLAQWGLQLAAGLGSEVQLMALARIGGARGPQACLPWHYTALEIPGYAGSLRAPTALAGVHMLANWQDIAAMSHQELGRSVRGYQVKPDPELMRDDRFLKEAAALAARQMKPIYFEGSVLGHAYYTMAREGATVVPVSEEPNPDPKIYHKLVRDQIPVIIKRAGGLARVRRVPVAEARALLSQKLIEEAFEVKNASPAEIAGELADVLDVIEALRTHTDISEEELGKVREKKRRQRGGFEELVYLEETAIRPLRSPANAGLLPLFQDEPSAPPGASAVPPAQILRALPRDITSDLLAFNISLVPPIDVSPVTIEVTIGDSSLSESLRHTEIVDKFELEITYNGPRAEIRMRRKRSASEAAQWLLPFPEPAPVGVPAAMDCEPNKE